MTTAARKHTHVTAAEYLAAENDGLVRHEFVDGALYAMAGASARHNLIRSEVDGILANLAPSSCQVFSAEMKLLIKTNDAERYYYPDVFVSCDPSDRDAYVRRSASLVVEILSPTTERIDRTEKFEAYKLVPSVIEYALFSQDAMELELFRRRTMWQREFYQGEMTVTLESLAATMNISTFYRRVSFDP
jgi:Uma2 family endonuclease